MKKVTINRLRMILFAFLYLATPCVLISQTRPKQITGPTGILRDYHEFRNHQDLPAIFGSQSQSNASWQQPALNTGLSGKIILDEIIQEKIDTLTGQFHPYYKIAFAYTEAGQMSQYLESRWDDSMNQWQPSFKEEITYDGNGNMAQRMASDYNWETSLYTSSFKVEYAYDTSGLLDMSFMYGYDQTSSQWMNIMNSNHSYNEDSDLVSELTYYKYDTAGPWDIAARERHFYGNDGFVTSSVRSFWMLETREWQYFWKLLYTYDNYGNPLTSEILIPDNPFTGEFISQDKYEFLYDYSADLSMLILPSPSFMIASVIKEIHHKPLGAKRYSYKNQSWIQDRRSTYHYREVSSATQEQQKARNIKVYPNPSSGMVTAELNEMTDRGTIEIFDMSGRRIAYSDFTGRIRLKIEDQASGIVSYSIFTNGYRQSGKIIIND